MVSQQNRARLDRRVAGVVKRISLEDIALGAPPLELASREAGDTILFCGGETLFRAGLVSLVGGREGLYVLGETDGVGEAAATVERLHPTIVVIDIGAAPLPEVGPVLRRVHRAAPSARILAVTADDHPAARRRLIECGAAVVVGKNEPADVFLHAVAWLRNREGDRPQPGPIEREAEARVPLSTREIDIVRLVCRGLRNEEIARVLTISEATVRHHLTSIFSKRRVSSRAALIVQAYNTGWK